MGRALRIEYPGALYHVTSRGNEKKDIFLDDIGRKRFLNILEDYHDRYGIQIHCYVLMGNHYHLVMETPQANLLKVMHGLNSAYTGFFNHRYGRVGHLFQGRYQAILVEKESYLLELSRYVHLNPVKAGMVDRPERYQWSSYPGYVWKSKAEPWVEYEGVLFCFDQNAKRGRERYREFVNRGLKENEKNPFEAVYGRMILGREAFIEKMKEMLKGKSIAQEIVDRKGLRQTPNAEDIKAAVFSVFGIEERMLHGKNKRNNSARKAAIYLIKCYSGLSNREIGEMFENMHYSAVSKLSARFEKELAENGRLRTLVEKVMSNVKA